MIDRSQVLNRNRQTEHAELIPISKPRLIPKPKISDHLQWFIQTYHHKLIWFILTFYSSQIKTAPSIQRNLNAKHQPRTQSSFWGKPNFQWWLAKNITPLDCQWFERPGAGWPITSSSSATTTTPPTIPSRPSMETWWKLFKNVLKLQI